MTEKFALKSLVYTLMLSGLLAGCATQARDHNTNGHKAQSGFIGDPDFRLDPQRKDWQNGYYVDVTGRFVPLKGQNPDSLGEGGGAPSVWYRVNKTELRK